MSKAESNRRRRENGRAAKKLRREAALAAQKKLDDEARERRVLAETRRFEQELSWRWGSSGRVLGRREHNHPEGTARHQHVHKNVTERLRAKRRAETASRPHNRTLLAMMLVGALGGLR